MRSTRSSSFKSKFKNTVETALNLEDDNDDSVAETEGNNFFVLFNVYLVRKNVVEFRKCF